MEACQPPKPPTLRAKIVHTSKIIMAYASYGKDEPPIIDTPHVMQQLEERFFQLATPDLESLRNRDDNELHNIRKNLCDVERENAGLSLDVQRLESELDTIKAWTQTLERKNRIKTIVLSEAEAVRAQLQALQTTIEKKDAELATLNANATKAAQEALRTRARIQTLKTTNSELTMKNATLERSLSDANDRLNSANISQSSFNELHSMLTVQKNVSAELAIENDRLEEAQASNAQILKSREEEIAFYEAKLSNVECDLEEALASAWQDRNRYVP